MRTDHIRRVRSKAVKFRKCFQPENASAISSQWLCLVILGCSTVAWFHGRSNNFTGTFICSARYLAIVGESSTAKVYSLVANSDRETTIVSSVVNRPYLLT